VSCSCRRARRAICAACRRVRCARAVVLWKSVGNRHRVAAGSGRSSSRIRRCCPRSQRSAHYNAIIVELEEEPVVSASPATSSPAADGEINEIDPSTIVIRRNQCESSSTKSTTYSSQGGSALSAVHCTTGPPKFDLPRTRNESRARAHSGAVPRTRQSGQSGALVVRRSTPRKRSLLHRGDYGTRCGVDGEPEHIGAVVVTDWVKQPPAERRRSRGPSSATSTSSE